MHFIKNKMPKLMGNAHPAARGGERGVHFDHVSVTQTQQLSVPIEDSLPDPANLQNVVLALFSVIYD